ncbi:interleukin-23 subunit alpha-like [Dicentrarchus labrax]|uniref:interleukin-23 subunit alpha-like n=1 Tax=Dicentrarchus labrax TaxID=13489 RepID=UPI0021F596AA|nr:interleukin-23 subunit alpha-like [Dicentrarchus labrax]
MDFCFATFAALFLLFSAASCAPAGHSLHDACAAVQRSSLELNHLAKGVSVEARNGSKHMGTFTTNLVWMEAKDMCDPESLRQKSEPCISKIHDVLMSYNSLMKRLEQFSSCARFASKVMPAMHKLHTDMSKCVNAITGVNPHKHISNEETHPMMPRWEQNLLCRYTLDRLFSFSILTARVFAVGDPAHHADGSAQKCL